jgi:hypothetical protein
MALDERVKEHIKNLQRNIKANILEDVGDRVRQGFLDMVLHYTAS